MGAFLFSWNPKNWEWDDLQNQITSISQTGVSVGQWSIMSHTKSNVGDRAFLIKTGPSKPRGMMASGVIKSEPYLSKHWSKDKMIYRVVIDFDTILDPEKDKLLSTELLNENLNYIWGPQGSGMEMPEDIEAELEEYWFNFLTESNKVISSSKQIDSKEISQYTEGASRRIESIRYERNPRARKLCLEYHGYNCAVCDLNFENTYGDVGKDFIHVHHLNQISDAGNGKINPIKDLIPVCPNCHAMIHRKKIPYTPKEIKELLKS